MLTEKYLAAISISVKFWIKCVLLFICLLGLNQLCFEASKGKMQTWIFYLFVYFILFTAICVADSFFALILSCFCFFLAENLRVFSICCCFQAVCRRHNISVSGDTCTLAGSESQLRWHLGLHQANLEVRTYAWFL